MSQTKAAALPRAAGSWGIPGFNLSALADMGVPLAVLAIVLSLITPLPSFLLDFLIVVDIMMSVVVLMVAIHVAKPVDFSVFPTTLLLLTLFRLALNVSSSRLILLNGNAGTSAAGHVIEAFGNFVVGGNFIIGTVMFLVLIAIQYIVINHGAVRISEVTARFTLDALPGKQMSIDADLNGGLIDDTEAKRRRKQLAAETEFHGAMDGASRFTQRDAVAGILITGINIIAGFLIGVFQHGMDMKSALTTYTILTIGDGLVTVIPSLLISVSGAMIVTRASSDGTLGHEFQKQLFTSPTPMLLAGGVMVLMSLLPGMPMFPFLLLGGGLGTIGWRVRQNIGGATAEALPALTAPAAAKENLEPLLKVEPLAVELGLGLVNFVEGGASSPMLMRISGIRRQMASSMGYLLPPVRVTDNVRLKSREYVILLKGAEIARYELPPGCDLAIPGTRPDPSVEGRPTKEPAFGLAASWVTAERVELARAAGYTLVDSVNVLGTHLAELARRHAHELLSRQDTKAICDRVAQEHPKVVEDLVPKLLSLAVVQRVLQNLLREYVSVRDTVSIFESLSEAAGTTRNHVLLTEYVRQAIRRTVVKPYQSANGDLPAFLMDHTLEVAIESSVQHNEQNSVLAMAPQAVRDILQKIERKVERPDAPVVILTTSGCRYFLRQVAEQTMNNVTFLSHGEIPPGVRVLNRGIIQ